MFKKICLALICINLIKLALAADRFIVKYKPTAAQSKMLVQGGASSKIAIEQMQKPLSRARLKSLSNFASGIDIQEINQMATGAHVIILNKNLNEKETANFMHSVKEESGIDYIEKDQILKPVKVSSNPNWQWDMHAAGDFALNPQWEGDNFSKAWTLLNGVNQGAGSNILVGVVDTGYTPHANFLGSLQQLGNAPGKYGYQFISDCRISGDCPPNTPDSKATNYPYHADALDLGDYVSKSDINASNGFFTNDCLSSLSSWHGSHVTGIIAANGFTSSNPSYMAGGAYGTGVVPVRVLGKCGGFLSDVTNGMLWLAGLPVISNGVAVPPNPHPVQVISMSLGGYGACTNTEQDTIDKINAITPNPPIIVVAAGNDEDDISHHNPSGCKGVIVVAAKGPTNNLAYYSNYGATTITASGGDSTVAGCYAESNGARICPSKIYSTIWSSLQGYETESMGGISDFAFYEGTSMATPHVAAAVANIISLLKSKNKNYTLYGITAILQQTAKTYTNCGDYGCAGTGTLDAASAINYVLQNDDVPVMPPPIAPLVSISGISNGGSGGGCSAITNGDDYSLILLLISSGLYGYRRKKLKINKCEKGRFNGQNEAKLE
jgi:serine protease